jgi:hypothetical protein
MEKKGTVVKCILVWCVSLSSMDEEKRVKINNMVLKEEKKNTHN